MTLTLISNYINHHQIPLSDCFYEMLGDGYHFVQTEPMDEERRAMGWQADNAGLPYLVYAYEQPEKVQKLLMESDVVIFGGCEDQEQIQPRLLAGKVTFRYSERLYREGQWKFITPRGLKQKYHDHTRFRKAPVYLLCAGGYVASDFKLVHAYPDKMFRWGYFTEFRAYENDDCHIRRINNARPSIVWAGRFIDVKHPEEALWAAKELKNAGLRFHLKMIGGGALETQMHHLAESYGIMDCVEFLGVQKPEQVRDEMERADIHLFTSDYGEGWGAVLNEAMNSGCAVVANQGIGATPYLITHGSNGYVYPNGDRKALLDCLRELLENPERCREVGRKAYETIRDEWNPQTAAKRFLVVCEQLQPYSGQNKKAPGISGLTVAQTGPMSKSPILSPGFWQNGTGSTRK